MALTSPQCGSDVASPVPSTQPVDTHDTERVAIVLIRAAARVLEAEGALRRLSSEWIHVRTSSRS